MEEVLSWPAFTSGGSCFTAFNWEGGRPGANPPRLVKFPEEKLDAP
jgi:hypothetical protein